MDLYSFLSSNVADRVWLFLPRLAGALIILLAFWVLSSVIRKVINAVGEKSALDDDVMHFAARTASTATVLFGIVTALGTVGINVTALVAGLGLTGFALGFALRDIVANILSGILILIYHPFDKGDEITVSGHTGKVAAIDLRYTALDADGRTVLVPNSTLFNQVISVSGK